MFLPWKIGRSAFLGYESTQSKAKVGQDNTTGTRGFLPIATFASLATVTSVVAGCGGGLLSAGITGLSSTAVSLDAGQTYTFDAQMVGAPNVTWSLAGSDCVGTNCGELSSSTGASVRYTAPATVAKQQSVILKATLSGTSAEGSTATIALNPHLALTGMALPSTVAGTAYNANLQTQGGMAPYTWTVTSGSLPSGLTLDANTGKITGAPLAAGSSTFSAQVADASMAKATAQASFTLNVVPSTAPLSFATNALARGTVGTGYAAQLQALGGTQPYTYSVAAGSLPSGLTLTPAGVIAGSPTAAGTSALTVRVLDAQSGGSATAALSLSVMPAPLALNSSALPNAAVGTAYNSPLAIAGGAAPYVCSVATGSLPEGMSIHGCTVTGTAATASTASVTVKVTDSAAPTSQIAGTLSLKVMPAALSIATTALPKAALGLSYSGSISASGGTAPYTCTIASGALPSGLQLNGCNIGGRLTGASGSSFAVRVTDASSPAKSVDGRFTISLAAQPLMFLSTTLTNGTAGVSYKTNVAAFGGIAPYQCSITGGSLAPGLGLNGCSISGIPTAAGSGSVTVQVTDAQSPAALATGTLNWAIAPGGLSLTTKVLPNGITGVPYAGTIAAIGGTLPYTCSVTGTPLPSGLTLSGCSVTGTPAIAAVVPVSIRLTDSGSPAGSVSGSYVFTIAPAALKLSTTSLPAVVAGAPYSAVIAATGGTAPYSCSVTGGALPEGTLLHGCAVTGSPTRAGAGSVTVQVTDAGSPAAFTRGDVSWTVANPALVLATTRLPDATLGTSYSSALTVTGGTSPYTCSILGGALPSGLVLSGCSITGKPSKVGSGSVTIEAKDASAPSVSVTGAVNWTVDPASLTLGSTNLPKATIGTAYKATIAIRGGTAPYTCSIADGSLAGGLSLQGCAVSGTPTAAGTQRFSVRVTDLSSPTQSITGNLDVLVAPASLHITTTTLAAKVTAPFSSTIAVAGGVAPYTCSLSAGSLPAGLLMNGCGISGTPIAAGASKVTVKVADASSPAAVASGTLSVTITPAALSLATTALPSGTAAVFYSSTIAATGGTGPYTCSLLAGSLPAGLSMAGCAITGTPSSASAAALTVQVNDAGSPVQTASGPVSLTIAPAVLTLANATMPPAVAGQPYTGSMTATGGTAPYSYGLASGALPAGLVLAKDGSISGVPTGAGTVNFSARVSDAGSPPMSATHAFLITVATPALTLTSAALPAATAGQPYRAAVNVTGGTAPYSCSLVSGALPAGLGLSGCAVTGTANGTGSVTVAVQATDASAPAQVTSGRITLAVNASPLQIVTTKLTNATASVAYSAQVNVSGGNGAVSCAVTAGNLPAGLQLNGPACLISGTPTSAGTASVTITVTDQNTPSADTASATLPLTVNAAAMSVSTAQIATPVLGQVYTQTLQITGGQAPYTFGVAAGALPRGLALSAGGVISGTPSAAGASSFTVSVEDSAATAQTATQQYVPLVVYPAAANDAQLSGPFAFLLQGYDAAAGGDLPYQSASAGSFTADGAGLVQNGEMDSNHQSAAKTGLIEPAHFIGTYQVGADERGLLTITPMNADGTTGASMTYAIAAGAETAADGSESAASVAAAGGNPLQANGAPGMLLAQDKTAFAQALKGNYAFGLKGDTPCLKTCVIGITGGPAAEVGQFTTDGAGAIVNGTADSNIAASNSAQAPLSGSYGTADANGRLPLTLNTAGTPAGVYPSSFAVYVVDANESLIVSSDSHATHVLLSGTAELQTQSSFSNASMSGAVLASVNAIVDPTSLSVSLDAVSSAATATVFRSTATADGSCAITNVDIAGAAQLTAAVKATGNNGVGIAALLGAKQTTGAVSCNVAANGRGVLTTPTPSATISGALSSTGLTAMAEAARVFYLVAPGRGYFLETGYAALGSFEPQPAEAFSNASLNGTYRFGTGSPSSSTTGDDSGVLTADGAGSATLTPDAGSNGGGQSAAGASQTVAYAVKDAVAGRILMGSTVLYAVSPDRFFQLDLDSGTASPAVGSVQR